jgi:putative endonuclease
MTNRARSHVLYTGFTGYLVRRVFQHKNKLVQGFTSRYNLTRLVYYEQFVYPDAAIAREKEIKGWRRSKKIRLIESMNPLWRDLSEGWLTNTNRQKKPFNDDRNTNPPRRSPLRDRLPPYHASSRRPACRAYPECVIPKGRAFTSGPRDLAAAAPMLLDFHYLRHPEHSLYSYFICVIPNARVFSSGRRELACTPRMFMRRKQQPHALTVHLCSTRDPSVG